MQQHTIARLSTLLIMRLLFVGVLAVPALNHIIDPGVDLIVARDDPTGSKSRSSHHTVLVTQTETVTVDPIVTAVSQSVKASVTVTVTAVKTTIVNTVTVDPRAKTNSSASNSAEATVDKQSDTDGTTTAASDTDKTSANTQSSTGSDATTSATTGTVSTTSTDVTASSVIPFQHATSTSSRLQTLTKGNSMTTFATITSVDSSSSSTSSFNDAVCDDIFCNTDGNKVCIYWAGYTSWDVSRGPMPGERPTVIGTC